MCNEIINIIVEDTVNHTEVSVISSDASVSVEVVESNTDVSVLTSEQINEVSIDVVNQVFEVDILIEPSTSIVAFTLSDDLIVVTAGKQSNTFVNNIFTFVNTSGYTNNTKTLIYTGALLTGSTHLFRYNSVNWTVDYTYTYTLGVYNGVSKTITKT